MTSTGAVKADTLILQWQCISRQSRIDPVGWSQNNSCELDRVCLNFSQLDPTQGGLFCDPFEQRKKVKWTYGAWWWRWCWQVNEWWWLVCACGLGERRMRWHQLLSMTPCCVRPVHVALSNKQKRFPSPDHCPFFTSATLPSRYPSHGTSAVLTLIKNLPFFFFFFVPVFCLLTSWI